MTKVGQGFGEVLEVLGETPVASEPGKGALHQNMLRIWHAAAGEPAGCAEARESGGARSRRRGRSRWQTGEGPIGVYFWRRNGPTTDCRWPRRR